MKHEITLDDAIGALDKDMDLAGCCSSRKRASKRLTYNPATLKYRVRHTKTDTGEQTSNSYHDPLIAIEKYNSYDV